MKTMESILRKIVGNNILHQRWLDTLSGLENCGARKIHEIQPAEQVPVVLLQHAAEEARHALLFKLFSGKVRGSSAEGSRVLLGLPLGRRYLRVLDLYCARQVRRTLELSKEEFHRACYLLTTLAIEKRAEDLYPLYERVLQESSASFSLAEIIREETQHLKLIARQIDQCAGLGELVEDILVYEKRLYLRWQRQLARDVEAE
jgi:rubrerythrin